jgi:hypothetical protein
VRPPRDLDHETAVSSCEMYCPSCGSDERQPSQYCRVCGTDLRAVRTILERPDSITASAVSARDRIGLAVAERIRLVEKAKDLEHIAEDVLPQIEKFLESPEERRLRRVRAGLITAAIGFGATAGAVLLALSEDDFIPFVLPALILLLVGLGVMINGLWFTVPRKQLPSSMWENLPTEPFELTQRPTLQTQNTAPVRQSLPSTVTEHTTHHLGGTPKAQ